MFLETIKKQIQQLITQKISNTKPKILLGLSGGPDSVFLLQILKTLVDNQTIELHAAHLDHEWRTNSHEDARFCQELCNDLGITLFIERAGNLALKNKSNGSQEELGRKMRRMFFEKIAKEHTCNFIALAHHLQDQQETFFIRLIRGATLDGLTCMKPIDGLYIRPLLTINKLDILNYLDTHNISYLHDPTNLSDEFLRNRIRNHVLPALNSCDKRFNQKFTTTLQSLQEENRFLENLTIDIFIGIFAFEQAHKRFVGNLTAFKTFDQVIQKRLLIHWFIQEQVSFSPSTAYLEEILRFLMSIQGGNHQLSTTWQLCKQQKSFWLEKHSQIL